MPTRSQATEENFAFSEDIVECRLEYESMHEIKQVNQEVGIKSAADTLILDMLFAGMPEAIAPDDEDQRRAIAVLKQNFGEDFDKHQREDKSINLSFCSGKEKALRRYYAQGSHQRKQWLPPDVKLWGNASTFETWLQTWIWSPLSGHLSHPEISSKGYLALSYVWNDCTHVPPAVFRNQETTRLIKFCQAGGMTLAEMVACTGVPPDDPFITGVERGQSPPYIILDGRRHQVTVNLHKALRCLREIPEVQRGRRVWVDSLCIN